MKTQYKSSILKIPLCILPALLACAAVDAQAQIDATDLVYV